MNITIPRIAPYLNHCSTTNSTKLLEGDLLIHFLLIKYKNRNITKNLKKPSTIEFDSIINCLFSKFWHRLKVNISNKIVKS